MKPFCLNYCSSGDKEKQKEKKQIKHVKNTHFVQSHGHIQKIGLCGCEFFYGFTNFKNSILE